jgi:glycosyltransferase involved in cell wall biosynthesis
VLASEPETHLLIVGDGTESNNLKSLAKQLGVDKKISFTGKVSDEELVELHHVGTVYCMPSPAELQSIATLEAMASGQPIVAVDAGALGELCQDGRNGYLCKQDDDEAMAEGLLAIISNPKKRATMSKESLAIAQTHDLETTLNLFEKIYTDLINA